MTAFYALLAIGLVGMAYKGFFVLTAGLWTFPPRLERALRFASPAMLAAMLGAALSPVSHGGSQASPAVLAALVAGAAVAHRSRSIGWTLLAGLAAFWVITGLGLG